MQSRFFAFAHICWILQIVSLWEPGSFWQNFYTVSFVFFSCPMNVYVCTSMYHSTTLESAVFFHFLLWYLMKKKEHGVGCLPFHICFVGRISIFFSIITTWTIIIQIIWLVYYLLYLKNINFISCVYFVKLSISTYDVWFFLSYSYISGRSSTKSAMIEFWNRNLEKYIVCRCV